MRFVYTQEHLDWLRGHYPRMLIDDLARAFNVRFGLQKTPGQIKSTLSNHKIYCGRPVGSPTGTMRLVTTEQAGFIEQEYPKRSIKELTIMVNDKYGLELNPEQLKTFCTNHSIASGRDGRFKPGHESWNKDTKGLTSANKTSFKKGSIPPNIKPLGHERICTKDGFILIKVNERNPYTGAPTRYKHKHVVVWEAVNSPVPAGHVVKFLDGDKTNCDIDNLIMITRAELCYLNKNGYNELPDELKPTFRALAKLISATKAAGRQARAA